MSNPPTRPALRERYDRRQHEVTLEAARVFARRGYERTTIQDLVAELGIAAGGLYHYIGSKEALLIRICDQLMDPLLARTRELLAKERAAPDQLRALVRLWVAHVIEHRDHVLVFQQVRHLIESDDEWANVRRSRKAFERLLEGVLTQAREDDDRIVLAALLGMVNHTVQWYRPNGRLSPGDIADGYLALVLDEKRATRQADRPTR